MEPLPRILIVGAGLAGLGLLHALQRVGLNADLMEREETSRGGAGILLTGNAVECLDAMELGHVVRSRSRAVSRVSFCNQDGSPLFGLDLPSRWPDFVSAERSVIREILIEAVRPVVPEWGCTPTKFTSSATGIDVRDSAGRAREYDLVVGADGVHSQVAEQLMATPKAVALPQYHGWRFIGDCPPDLVEPTYMIGNGRTLLFHPLPGGRVYCGAGPIFSGEKPIPANSHDAVRQAFSDFGGPAPAFLSELGEATELIPTRYWHITRESWIGDRCVLIGDAAHACVPTLAQGGAMAFEDALLLGRLLGQHFGTSEDHDKGTELGPTAERTHHRNDSLTDAVARVLAAFEAGRRSRVSQVQRESLARLQANVLLDDKRLGIRDRVMRHIGREKLQGTWEALVTTARETEFPRP